MSKEFKAEIEQISRLTDGLLDEVYEAWELLEEVYQYGELAVDDDNFQDSLQLWIDRRNKKIKEVTK